MPEACLEIITWKSVRLTLKTIGWLVAENDKVILLTQHLQVDNKGKEEVHEVQFAIRKETIVKREKVG